MTPDGMDTVLLVVSELVTNALVHTDGQVRLDLTLLENKLRVSVADSSARTPVKPTSIGWEATGGRGILLVEAMSETWGTVPVSGGKQVWAGSRSRCDVGGEPPWWRTPEPGRSTRRVHAPVGPVHRRLAGRPPGTRSAGTDEEGR